MTGTRGGWTWEQALCGVIPPLLTPIGRDEAPDLGALSALVEHVLTGGCTGLFVLGGCGAGPWHTSDDRSAVVAAAVRAARGRVPVLAGVMLPSTRTAAREARRAEEAGADAIVVTTPYYFPVDAAAQQRHVEGLLRAVSIPLLLYNIPQCTGQRFDLATVVTLAAEPRVRGIKDSAGDFAAFLQFVAIKQQRPDFRVLQGSEPLMAPSLQHGGDGLIPGLANVAPQLFVALRDAARAGDPATCRELQARAVALKQIERDGWLPGLTAACALLGIGDGTPPAPFAPATAAHRALIAEVLRSTGAARDRSPAG